MVFNGDMKLIASLVFLLLNCACTIASAESVYQTPDAFIEEAFQGQVPEPEMLWLTDKLVKADIARILGHDYARFRIRYYRKAQRSVWVLDEIGKEKAITCGFIVEQGAITQFKVLIFRESRGWEIRHDFFSAQFKDIKIDKNLQLTQNIDNISGATLSVRAVKKLAALALYLHQHVIQ
jgi:hypothetical protein